MSDNVTPATLASSAEEDTDSQSPPRKKAKTDCRTRKKRNRSSAALLRRRVARARKRAAETPEERARRLQQQRDRYRRARENETEAERVSRLERRRATAAAARAATSTAAAPRSAVTRKGNIRLESAAFRYDPCMDYDEIRRSSIAIGSMNDVVCRHCRATRFPRESAMLCCNRGRVQIEPFLPPSEPLAALLTGETEESRHFMRNVRHYNACLRMSAPVDLDTDVGSDADISSFAPLSAQVRRRRHDADDLDDIPQASYSCLPSILPSQSSSDLNVTGGRRAPRSSVPPPRYWQLYFIEDEPAELKERVRLGRSFVRKCVMAKLQRFVHENNTVVRTVKAALQAMSTDQDRFVLSGHPVVVTSRAPTLAAEMADEEREGRRGVSTIPSPSTSSAIHVSAVPSSSQPASFVADPRDLDVGSPTSSQATISCSRSDQRNGAGGDSGGSGVEGDDGQDELSGLTMLDRHCDLLVHKRSDTLYRIPLTSRYHDPLAYPLVYWQGTDGYYDAIPFAAASDGGRIGRGIFISPRAYYAYMIMSRRENTDHLLRLRGLFAEFLVHAYRRVEMIHLRQIARYASTTRGSSREVCRRFGIFINPDASWIRLPTFLEHGPRAVRDIYLDAMVYVNSYGKPDLFITFTCNPQWSEITDELLHIPGGRCTYTDRPDLVARVFRLKLDRLFDLIFKNRVYGDVRCHLHTVEWQRRSDLPHAHILLWLARPILPEQLDSVISAEIPDPDADGELHRLVMRYMIHAPCDGTAAGRTTTMRKECHSSDAPSRCKSNFPKPFRSRTFVDRSDASRAVPHYRRRAPSTARDTGDGFTGTIRVPVVGGKAAVSRFRNITVDNRWVIPYTPILVRLMEAHVNVEYCSSVGAIRYVLKKDSALTVGNTEYTRPATGTVPTTSATTATADDPAARGRYPLVRSRYVSPGEAVWRIFCFPLRHRYPVVVPLHVHLDHSLDDEWAERFSSEGRPRSTLIAFFQLCQRDSFARDLLYEEIVRYYVWNHDFRFFSRRVRIRRRGRRQRRRAGVESTEHQLPFEDSHALYRFVIEEPGNPECCALLSLLRVIRGPTSFADLLTDPNGNVCPMFGLNCFRRGLLGDFD